MTNFKSVDFPKVRLVFAALVAFATLGAVLGGLLGAGLAAAQGLDPQAILGGLGDSSLPTDRSFVRSFLGLNHLCMFLLPGLAVAWVFYRNRAAIFLKINQSPRLSMILLGIAFLLISLPLVQYSYYLNKLIPLPAWATAMEDSTAEAIKNLLVMDSPWELFVNFLVIALLPGLGEEIVFRGIVQQQLLRRVANSHVAIWLGAAIFSAIHFQFEGFLPRMLLGALLGYLFFWTKNLWVNVAAHVFNNGAQVVGQYLFSKEISKIDLEKDIDVPIWAAAASLVALVFLAKFIIALSPKDEPPPPPAPPSERDLNVISLDDFR